MKIFHFRFEQDYPALEIEVDQSYKSIKHLLNGRRIVNLGHVLSEYEKICKHGDKCTMGKMTFVKETRFGLTSRLHFFCDNCEEATVLSTDPNNGENEITKAVVWGNMSIGIGKYQCEELFAIMDIPFMTQKTYSQTTAGIKKVALVNCISYTISKIFDFQIINLLILTPIMRNIYNKICKFFFIEKY